MPDLVWLTSASATESGSTGSAAAATSGSALPTTCQVGSLTLNGMAFVHDDVATWLDTLGKERGFISPYFTNSTETPIGQKQFVNFSSSVSLNNKAESGRYSKPAGC